ncbi:MAG: biotin transporter BioY [Acidobacteriota bacterium]
MQAIEAVTDRRPAARRAFLELLAVVGFAALTALLSQVSFHVPGIPVPATLQTLAVLASGYYLGARRAAASQLTYLVMGVIGLPVFAASPILPAGVGRLLGPTGGYLLAFPVAAAIAGYLLRRPLARSWWFRLAAFSAAGLVIHLCGLLWFGIVFKALASQLLLVSLLPFLPVDAAKSALLASIARRPSLGK